MEIKTPKDTLGNVESNSVDVHIHKLRRKLYPEVIRTVRGVGYIADPPPPGAQP